MIFGFAPTLSNHPMGMLIAMVVGLGLGLVVTFIGNKTQKEKSEVTE